MTRIRLAAVSLSLLSCLVIAAPAAHAFCGVIQETGQSKKPAKASKQASKLAQSKVKALRKQYGDKLVLDQRTASCLGGAVAIDANGKQVVGPATCTVTVPFCVNP